MMENNKVLGRPIEILLVEDNQTDVLLVKEAFRDSNLTNNINVAKDGKEALNYLFRKENYKDKMLPDIIFLDLNLPKMSDIEVLKVIKQDEELRVIPVIMLSTSNNKEDIINSYKNYANSYIIKPLDFDKFVEIIKTIESFWLTLTELPV